MSRVGETHCRNSACNCKDMAIHKTAANNLSGTCHKCGFPTFAKAGTKWRRDLEATITWDEPDTPAAPAPAPAASPAPAPKSTGLLIQ